MHQAGAAVQCIKLLDASRRRNARVGGLGGLLPNADGGAEVALPDR